MLAVNILLCFVMLTESREINNSHYFQISVVSSSDNAEQPAQFVSADTPLWDERTQSLFFVDTGTQKILRLDYVSGVIHNKMISVGPVRLLSLIDNSQRVVASIRSTLFLLDLKRPQDSGLRILSSLDSGHPDNIIQNGAADAKGRLWIATRGPKAVGTRDQVVPGHASLYSVSDTSFHSPRVHLRPLASGNGIAWAHNDSFLYLLDGQAKQILGFDFDSLRGELSSQRLIMNLSAYCEEDARPNHMIIDKDGYLWIAMMYGGKVLHVDPSTNQLIYPYKLPVNRVTALCWGGPGLNELFVTSAQSTEQTPLAGALFIIKGAGSGGRAAYRMIFDNADEY